MSDQALLFKTCRRALGLSVSGMQAALCLADERTIRRIEHGDIDVLGPSWVAITFMLREGGHDDLAQRVEGVRAERVRQFAAKRRANREAREDSAS